MVEPRLDGEPQIILTTDKTGHGYNSLILAAGVVLAEAGSDIPLCGRSIEGHYESKAQETWLNCNGWFLRLLTALAAPNVLSDKYGEF